MKKFLVIAMLLMPMSDALAQMNELIGELGVNGALTVESYQVLGNMQGALNRMKFQQDLANLNAQIQMTFLRDYRNIDKRYIEFEGFGNIQWDVIPVSSSSYYLELKNLDSASCLLCKSPEWRVKKLDINNGGDCNGESNNVKMFF